MAVSTIPQLYGTNANGAIKNPDGVMIVRMYKTYTGAISSAYGNAYYSSQLNLGNFPEAFIEQPYIFLQVYDQETGVWTSGAKNTTATSAGTTYLFAPRSFNSLSVGVQVIAIGRWK